MSATVAVGYRSPSMFPGALRRRHDPTSRPTIMAATGEVVTYAELDAAANRLSPAASPRPACGPATTSRSAWRTTRATSRWSGAPTTPGCVYTACSSRLTRGELAYIVERLRRPGLHHVAGTRPTRPPRSSPTRPGVQLRLMLDGVDRRLRAATRTPSPRSPAEPLPDRRRRHRHALLVGHDRPAEGREGDRCPTCRSATDPALVLLLDRCCSASADDDGVPVARRRCTTRLRCASTWPCSASAARRSSWSTSTPRSSWRSSSATSVTAHAGRADDVHPHAEAARGGARQVRRVVAASRRPRRRAVPGAGEASR